MAQCLPSARQHLRTILHEATEQEIRRAAPLTEAQSTLDWLKDEHGIEIIADGGIARGREPRLNLADDFPAVTGLMGKITREVFEKERDDLLRRHAAAKAETAEMANRLKRADPVAAKVAESKAAAHQRHLVRLRSAAGDGLHGWVEECPKTESLSLNDSEFNFAVRWRMGLAVVRPGLCQLHSKDDTDWCCRQLDPHGDHAVICHKGKGRYRMHGALCKCISRFARESQVEAENEEVCPQLLKGEPGAADAIEARLDVHLWAAGDQLYEEWVDVTTTHPWAKRQRQVAEREDGIAADKAEERKLTRYGSGTGGVRVAPAAFELWGRIGNSCHSILLRLAAQKCRSATEGSPQRILRRWLAEMGVALYRAMAETIAQSCRRTVPADALSDEEVEAIV